MFNSDTKLSKSEVFLKILPIITSLCPSNSGAEADQRDYGHSHGFIRWNELLSVKVNPCMHYYHHYLLTAS